MNEDEAGGRAMDRVADVIHEPPVAVVPLPGHADGVDVVLPERTRQLPPRLFRERDPQSVLHQQETEGIADDALHIKAVRPQVGGDLLAYWGRWRQ